MFLTIIETERTTCCRGYLMVHDVFNMRLGMDLKVPVDVDVDGEFVSPSTNRLRSFLSSIAHKAK